jgi:hypothetical protein
MPVYSLSRTLPQYTTVAQIETAGNQNGYTYDGVDGNSYHTSVIVDYLTVCPTANRTWNYFTPSAPSGTYVWYPYNLTMACSGGNPRAAPPPTPGTLQGQRNGYAYFKMYTSIGTFLMSSSVGVPTSPLVAATSIPIYNALAAGGIIPDTTVQATAFPFTNSRKTITLTANTTFLFGFTNVYTSTQFFTIFARKTGQTGQLIYINAGETAATNVTTGSTVNSGIAQSMLGFVGYNAAPVQPTSLTITTTSTGISITCQGDEVNSLSSGTTVGAVTRLLLFYSSTSGGTYNVATTITTITRTLVSGTTYRYTAQATGTYSDALILGHSYFFKVASINDVCIQYQAEAASRVAAGQQSIAVQQVYGSADIVKVRNSTNTAWANASIFVRTLIGDTLQWSGATIKKRSSTNTWLNSVSGSIYVFDSPTTPGTSYILEAQLTGDTATAYSWSRVSGATASFTSITAKIVTVNGPSIGSTVVQCIISYNGGTFTATTTINWGMI